MHITPDEIIFWQFGFLKLNATIVFTWLIMAILVLSAYLITRKLNDQLQPTRWQNGLEVLVVTILQQISEAGLRKPAKYIGFLGTLFLFIATANLLTIFPRFEPPTGSLSTTIALSFCVFISVPYYGIKQKGVLKYLQSYAQPNVFMLPFNIIGELSRTLALSVRLFGNMMSGAMIIAILLIISPFVFPIIMSLLGLLTGMVQAYIFFILAAVYIAAATAQDQQSTPNLHQYPFRHRRKLMDNLTLIAICSIITAGLTIGIGVLGPSLAEGTAIANALKALAQQPDASSTITRTLFVGLAMIESTAIYCFVVSMIVLFSNPFWNYFVDKVGN
ncbi:hypothetical protein NBRC116595_10520 [Aliiglaciecola sp. NS0011-25]